MECQVKLLNAWVSVYQLDDILAKTGGPHAEGVESVEFKFPAGCKVMVNTAVELLSLINQLTHRDREVRLIFENDDDAVVSYLGRMGFFDFLADTVSMNIDRPRVSRAQKYRGRNADLVEITRLRPSDREEGLPTRLSNAVLRNFSLDPESAEELDGATWTIFAELIDNVYSHSQSEIDGYAALQFYPEKKRLIVAVSDSGLGLLNTLRPTLQSGFPGLETATDSEVLYKAFTEGLSRHGPIQGCGLKGCAMKALKYNGTLHVRLETESIGLQHHERRDGLKIVYFDEKLSPLHGTHIHFRFDDLDGR